jgi:hypothetical protein
MAEPISAAAAAFAQWAVTTAASAGVHSLAAAQIIYVAAYAAAYVGITATVSMGLGALARAQMPDPESQKITRKQPRPSRYLAIGGLSRMSGAYMLREAKGNKMAAVLAICEGRLARITRIYVSDYLTSFRVDDYIAAGPNEMFGGGDLLRIQTRLGLPVETHYSFLTPVFGDVWPTTSRGDGIASLAFLAEHRSRESFSRHYPQGEPIPSIVGAPVCYDWRDPAQDREDEDTWQESWNPVVWLVHLEWYRFGRRWDRCIAPVLDALTAEADYCDELVPTSTGTEPRYTMAGNFPINTEPGAVREAVLTTMDGWLSVDGKGRLVILAGRYDAPTHTIEADQIKGYSWRSFQIAEEQINTLIVSYLSADNDFTETPAGIWQNEAEVEAVGEEKAENLVLTFVPSRSQSMRLAKRKMSRLTAAKRGTVRTGISGLSGLGQRYLRVKNPELNSMADVVVEVLNVEIDFSAAQVVFDVILADPEIDAWDPAEEEGPIPPVIVRPEPEDLVAPTIVSVVTEELVEGCRIQVTIEDPERTDFDYLLRWRVQDSGSSYVVEEPFPAFGPSTVILLTSLVPFGLIEVGVAFKTGSPGPWATLGDITTAPAVVAITEDDDTIITEDDFIVVGD